MVGLEFGFSSGWSRPQGSCLWVIWLTASCQELAGVPTSNLNTPILNSHWQQPVILVWLARSQTLTLLQHVIENKGLLAKHHLWLSRNCLFWWWEYRGSIWFSFQTKGFISPPSSRTKSRVFQIFGSTLIKANNTLIDAIRERKREGMAARRQVWKTHPWSLRRSGPTAGFQCPGYQHWVVPPSQTIKHPLLTRESDSFCMVPPIIRNPHLQPHDLTGRTKGSFPI